MLELIGKKIARLRQELGWTQSELAGRAAISRVAVSHIESGLSLPGERTLTLLAGLFKLRPFELTSGTTYPQAKAERLPMLACCYTEVELQVRLLQVDISWLEALRAEGLPEATQARMQHALWQRWSPCLDALRAEYPGEREQKSLAGAYQALQQATYPQ